MKQKGILWTGPMVNHFVGAQSSTESLSTSWRIQASVVKEPFTEKVKYLGRNMPQHDRHDAWSLSLDDFIADICDIQVRRLLTSTYKPRVI